MDVVLPKNSLTMTEATIVEWLVGEGEAVSAGAPLFIMETEKSEVEVEAVASGTLQAILCPAGTVASAGTVIAVVDTGDSDSSWTTVVGGERSVAPAALELAQHLGIDINDVRGSGVNGRVIEVDVLKHATSKDSAGVSGGNRDTEGSQAANPEAKVNGKSSSADDVPSRKADFTRNRVIGNQSTMWSVNVPTFYLASSLSIAKSRNLNDASISDLLIVAAAKAAREVQVANGFVTNEGEVRIYDEVRIGLLVRDKDALLPLVFADPDRMSLSELHAKRRKLMSQVGGDTLPSDATRWPTLVISNIGRPGVDWFTAVLFPGTSVTIAVGSSGRSEPNVEMVLTCDHRVLDGVDAAEFAAAMDRAISEL
jgi:pyruvate dehydrogenase E2 component (dihydrolipoamide acetyltransferase)